MCYDVGALEVERLDQVRDIRRLISEAVEAVDAGACAIATTVHDDTAILGECRLTGDEHERVRQTSAVNEPHRLADALVGVFERAAGYRCSLQRLHRRRTCGEF